MQQDTSHLWQEALKDALGETEPRIARAKVAHAEFAVFNRIDDFNPSPNFSEEQALFDAIKTIRTLKRALAP